MSGGMTSSKRAWLGGGALLLAAACGGPPPAEEAPPRLVRYLEIAETGAGRARSFAGVAQSAEEPRLSFKVGGTVVALPVDVGDRVGRGDLIAELEPMDYQLSLEDAQAALRRAQAEARNAESGFARTRDLYENGNASRTDYDTARAYAESARAAVVSAEKRIELAERQLSYTRLTAPAAGAIASVDVALNENVQPGQPIVMLVASAGGLEVRVTMPESLIAHVGRDQEVSVRFDALPGEALPARVTEVGVAATGSGTTFPVTVRLDEARADVRAGMAAEVEFRFDTSEDAGAVHLPAHCVAEDDGGRFVWVVEGAGDGLGVARRRAVEIGELTSDGLEILDGLSGGERVVTAGISSLSDGQEVRTAVGGDAR